MMSYVGIDVAKRTLQIAIHPDGSAFQVDNNAVGHEELIARLETGHEPIKRIVLEATGGYEEAALEALSAHWAVVRVAPQRARAFAQFMGTTAKTDPIDARMLALMAETLRDPPTSLPSHSQRYVQDLSKRRQQLVEARDDERRRLQQANESFVVNSIKRQIRHLSEDIARMDKAIEAALERTHSEITIRLRAVKCLGPVTATALVAFLPELGRVNRRQISALVGVAPYNNSSGDKDRKRSIHGGRFYVRRALYMATLSAIRHQSDFKERYQRLLERGKLPKVAITACMRVLLIRLNAMIRDQTEWQDHPV